ncbi:hypothetical protein [Caldivirga sp.]|uniref:hypothetical protein n=1 Tax=Caldivirga sp. TaxID=2080243 RepID=UPI0025C692E4|nr:hypothetical protein [Caldivirga sp.]
MQQTPHPLTYKFVRYCVNKAYSKLIAGFKENDANILYSIETIVNELRNAEGGFKSINDVVNFLTGDFLSEYRRAISTLKSDLTTQLFKDILNNCMDLDEVKGNVELVNVIKNVMEKMASIKPEEKLAEEVNATS